MMEYMHALFPVTQLCLSRQFETCAGMVDCSYESLYLEKQLESKYMEC